MPVTFQIEREIEECDDRLYDAEPSALSVQGFDNVSADDVRRYHEQGYLVVKGAYSPERAERGRLELQAMTGMDDPQCSSVDYEWGIWRLVEARGFARRAAGERDWSEEERTRLRETLLSIDPVTRGRLVRKFVGFTKHHPPLGELAHDPTLMGALAKLIGEPAKLYVSQAMIKPPGGREKPWHQDHAYFNYPIDTRIVGVWIALDQATAENGCMRVLPGGHQSGPRPHWKRRDWQICDADILGQPIVSVPLDPGDALLFDGKIPHGTPPNRTEAIRWAVQYHYVPARAEMVDEAIRLAAFGGEGTYVSC